MLCSTLATAATAWAEDATEEPVPAVVETPPPTAIPPTPVPPTAIPTPPLEPTMVPPTEEPVPTEALLPTEVTATDVPVALTEEPTEVPTATPTETPTPKAMLSHALASHPTCALAPNQPATLAVGDALVYDCADELALAGSDIIPQAVGLTWTVRADVVGGWTVRLLPPVNDPATETAVWTQNGLADTWFDFVQREPLGASTEPVAVDQTVRIGFRVLVERTACTAVAQQVRLRHAISVASPETEITALPREQVDPLRLAPSIAAITAPTVTITTLPTFAPFEATSAGLVEQSRSGEIVLVVTGLDTSCGTWSVTLSASAIQGNTDQPVAGASLRSESCDLSGAGCVVATFASGLGAASTRIVSVPVTLFLPTMAPLGDYSMTFSTDMRSADAQGLHLTGRRRE